MYIVEDLRKIYADKLIETGSHDAAFTKAVWMAYLKGLEDSKGAKEKCHRDEIITPEV